MDLFNCPPPTSLADVPSTSCPIRFDQIQKLLFRRIGGKAALTPSSILLSATITPLLTATDDTKLLVSPFLSNVVIPQTEVLKEGGNDNTTLNGIPQLRGLGFAAVSAQVRNISSDAAAALRALASESALQPGTTNLEAFFVNRHGEVIGKTDGTNVHGFEIFNFAVSDPGSEGFAQDNIFTVSFDLKPGWSDGFEKFKPTDYNPLTIAN